MNAVWIKNKSLEKNYSCAFALKAVVPTDGRLVICAKNIYNVYIDGHFTCQGPSRCAHGRNEYDVLELDTFAEKEIPIVIEILSYNIYMFESANDRPYFSAEITSHEKTIYATEDFQAYCCTDKVQKVARYSYQRNFTEYYILPFDMRTRFRKGDFSVFPKEETEKVKSEMTVKRSVDMPKYKIVPAMECGRGDVFMDRSAPQMQDYYIDHVNEENGQGFSIPNYQRNNVEIVSRLVLSDTCTDTKDRYLLFDLKKEYSGFIRLSCDVLTDTKLYILFDEILMDEAENSGSSSTSGSRLHAYRMRTLNLLCYELKPGHYDLQSFEPYALRYAAVVSMDGFIENAEVSVVTYENPNAGALKFTCEDPAYVEIMDAARASFAQNAVDIFMDCPSRERAGWLCDSYFTSQAEKLLTGSNQVEAHFLSNYAECPDLPDIPNGMVPMCYPADFVFDRFIPNWAMWYVIQVRDHVKRNGKQSITEKTKRKILGLLDYFQKFENEEGLLENLDGWVFVEWSRANDFVQDVNFPSNMLYAGMLLASSELLQDPVLAKKAEHLITVIREKPKNGIFYIDNMVRRNGKLEMTENSTETCQYYAFYFGIATPLRDRELFHTLVTQFGALRDDSRVFPEIAKSNAFIGNYLRLDYLAQNGYASSVVKQCRDYFLYMARRTGTLWENTTPTASCNHGFASYAANILLMGLTGVRFISSHEKTVYLVDTEFTVDCDVLFPCDDGEQVRVTVKNKNRKITLPNGYKSVTKNHIACCGE